jgi:hypothetical protein
MSIERSLIIGPAPDIGETWAHNELYACGYYAPHYPVPAFVYCWRRDAWNGLDFVCEYGIGSDSRDD